MKIVFTSSHKTYPKENTKNYTPNSYVLVLLTSDLIFFFLLTIWDGCSIVISYMKEKLQLTPLKIIVVYGLCTIF